MVVSTSPCAPSGPHQGVARSEHRRTARSVAPSPAPGCTNTAPGTSAGSDDREPAPRDRRLRAARAGELLRRSGRGRVHARRSAASTAPTTPPFLRWLVNRGGETLGGTRHPAIRNGDADFVYISAQDGPFFRLSRRSTERASRTTSRRARPGCVRRPRLGSLSGIASSPEVRELAADFLLAPPPTSSLPPRLARTTGADAIQEPRWRAQGTMSRSTNAIA